MQGLPRNNRSNKGNIIRKTIPTIRVRTLKLRHCLRKLCHFYNKLNEKSQLYLFNLIINLNRVWETRHSSNIPEVYTRRNYFKNSLFCSTLSEWNNLDGKIRNSWSLSIFKKNLPNLIRSYANSIFNIHNPYGIKLLTRLRPGLSQPCDQKFRHCFQDTLYPLFDCGNDTETITHFFLHCPSFDTPRQTVLINIRNINENILCHD